MNLTKQQEQEVRQAYERYWESYRTGNTATFDSLLDDEVNLIGTTESEIFTGKAAVLAFFAATIEQVIGKVEMRNREIRLVPVDAMVQVFEFADLYILVEVEWIFYAKLRLTTLMRLVEGDWKIIQQHGSLPDSKAQDGETFAPEQVQRENLQLREAVKRRTVELEHKNRELELEGSLERVRAVAMSMKKPADMIDVCRVISEQLQLLEVRNIRNVQTAIINDDKGTYLNYEYFTQYNTSSVMEIVTKLHPTVEQFINEIKRARDAFFSASFEGEQLKDWIEYRKKTGQNADPILEQAESVHYYFHSIGPGALGLSTYAPLRDEELEIFKRFRNVFDLAYRRFLDIEQAEAHAKDARIELSLERVRARSLAMHRSSELVEASDVFFEQLHSLGIPVIRTGVSTFDESRSTVEVWSRSQITGESGQMILGVVPRTAHPFFEGCFDARIRKDAYFDYVLEGDEVERFYRSMSGYLSYPVTNSFNPREVFYIFFFAEGSLNVIRHERLSDEELNILQRFATVFGQMYRRFLDLQQAEAQAREAQIEAALERVRSKAMAMRDSHDLSATSGLVFTELRKLGVQSVRCGVLLLSKDTPQASLFFSTPSDEGDSLNFVGLLTLQGHPSLEQQYASWLRQDDYFVRLKGNDLQRYYEFIRKHNPVPFIASDRHEQEEHGYYLHFSVGQFYAWTQQPYSDEELSILNRFRAIFELTFRRYLDLQKAEAQAREAQIEASLERVRSRTLAMQKSSELAETAAVLFQQLIALGIAPNRLYIAIMNDDDGKAEFWITDEDGSKVSSAFATDLRGNRSFRKMLEGWHEGRTALTIDMQGDELQEYLQHLTTLNVPFKGGLSQPRRVQNIAYFSRGFLGIASPDSQPDETTTLLERFAAVFNLTLTRFTDLQLAEAQARQAHLDMIQLQTEKNRAEEALSELRAMQVQLLQQEKLASLGQLTAGIAHEIKNPLNFVNNFSSVSVELLDEVTEEIAAVPSLQGGDVPQLLADIRTNLKKIVEHGTRADGIVKSMLQHSRGGSGSKEPTDLNALIKEFVNLAFHGMRAGKNPINVDIALELSDSVGRVSVIAEDFSRVVINLCQNAFDAMREKVQAGDGNGPSGSYLPRLTVRTRREPERIVVEVGDNGPGIPDAIRDKILQPFFTTKKGTQGTGLGLSITHDIVKAHGGEMVIETNRDGGASFVIALPPAAQV